MSDFCKVYCSGFVKAPDNWITSVPMGIGRLVYIHGGDGGYIENDIMVPFKKGALYLFPGNAYHVATYSSYQSNEQRVDHAYVNFELIPPILSKKVFCLDTFDEETSSALEVFKTFCKQSSLNGDFVGLSESSQSFLKSTVIFLINKIVEKFNLKTITDKIIIHSLKLMHENLSNPKSINEIAKDSFLSPDGFIRKFKREIGETPYSYLKKLRIRTAQNMRLSGSNLNEIAEKCGYCDPSSLLHALKQKQ